MISLSAALLVLQVAAALPATEPPKAEVHESAHYRLTTYPPFDEGEEYLRLAEALYPQLQAHFGAEPDVDGKLEVFFWPDSAGFKAGGREAGIPLDQLQAGGIYWPPTKSAYFWKQPSAYSTRHLFLHELVHQFHYLSVMGNKGNTPTWYTEGIAEHFAWHNWDGKALVTGLSDVVALEERIPAMVKQARAGTLDLRAIVRGERGGPKPESWAVVHSLLTSPGKAMRKRFRAVEKRLWSRLPASKHEAAVLGNTPKRTTARLLAHIAGLMPTWKIDWISWDATGRALVAESRTVALLRTRETAESGTIEADLVPQSGSIGLIVGFRSLDEFVAVYRRPNGRIDLVRRLGGKWSNVDSADGPKGDRVRLRAEILKGGRVQVLRGKRVLIKAKLEGLEGNTAMGLFVDNGKGRFENVVLGEVKGSFRK
ncbi:MAG: hypothetical protein ACYTDX_00035 [Planctomycetota bacterium]|jgi:hypothetical protein